MLDCLILGDSIAKGISDIRTECTAIVQSGINSKDYWNKYSRYLKGDGPINVASKVTIISLGSNDLGNITDEYVRRIRATMPEGQTVYWIMPNIKESVRKTIWQVAKEYDDIVLDARKYDRSPDTVHPTYKGYKDMARETRSTNS